MMSLKQYVHAFFTLWQETPVEERETVTKRFVELMVGRGLKNQLPKIYNLVHVQVLKEERARRVEVVSKNQLSADSLFAYAKRLTPNVTPGDVVNIIDTQLIGGAIILLLVIVFASHGGPATTSNDTAASEHPFATSCRTWNRYR